MRVLIVEDEPDILQMLAAICRGEGYEVAEAADGGEAVRLVDEAEFDYVLLDLALPVKDGSAVARHLRTVERKKSLPPSYVLGNTGFEQFVEAREVFERAGIDDLIEKPIDPAWLKASLRREAEKRR